MTNRKPTPSVDFDSWLTGESDTSELDSASVTAIESSSDVKAESDKVIKTESDKKIKTESSLDSESNDAVPALSLNDVKDEKNKVIKTSSVNGPLLSTQQSVSRETIKPTAVGQVEESAEKIKATFHIDTATAERLDAIQYQLKRATGLRGHAISKSKILDILMQLTYAEVEQDGVHSRVSQLLLANQ